MDSNVLPLSPDKSELLNITYGADFIGNNLTPLPVKLWLIVEIGSTSFTYTDAPPQNGDVIFSDGTLIPASNSTFRAIIERKVIDIHRVKFSSSFGTVTTPGTLCTGEVTQPGEIQQSGILNGYVYGNSLTEATLFLNKFLPFLSQEDGVTANRQATVQGGFTLRYALNNNKGLSNYYHMYIPVNLFDLDMTSNEDDDKIGIDITYKRSDDLDMNTVFYKWSDAAALAITASRYTG